MEARAKEAIVDTRIKKVLSMRTDTVTMLDSLDAISEFFGKEGNTMDARRALRQDLEYQNILLAKKYMSEFDEVKSKLEVLENDTNIIVNECHMMANKVSSASDNMKIFMQKATELEEKRNHYITQSKDIKLFLERFQLSNDEINELYNAPITDYNTERYFNALRRLRNAYDDCKSMVEQYQYSSGFELLDVLGHHQDVSYQRLFEWVKKKCDEVSTSSSMDADDIPLQMAVRYLREVPAYFSQCQDLVISSRRTLLVQRFVLALTQGGVHKSTRAIELNANDPARYVGDMLACVHQIMASEQEFLQSIFGTEQDKGNDKMKPSFGVPKQISVQAKSVYSPDSGMDENGLDALSVSLSIPELLVRCLGGLGRPLKARVVHTLTSRSGGVESLYLLTDLLCFYNTTFERILPLENSISVAVKECFEQSQLIFAEALNKQADSLAQATSALFPVDLVASHTTKQCAKQVHDTLRVYETALSSLPSDVNGGACYIGNVLGAIITPLLQACRTCGKTTLHQNHGSDIAVYMLNNVTTIKVSRCI